MVQAHREQEESDHHELVSNHSCLVEPFDDEIIGLLLAS